MEGLASDKVNINVGGGEGGGGGGAGLAAVIAALGNRNQGNDNAALIAALGNRNDGHRGDDGYGLGGIAGLLPLLVLLPLLTGRRGVGAGDDCDGVSPAQAALLQSLVEGQADIRASVPTSALETTNAIQQALAQLALGAQQGFANVKDAVQNIGALNLLATKDVAKDIATSTLTTTINVKDDGEKTRLLITNFNNENLQRQLTVAQSALSEERMHRHNDGVEVRVSQNVNQVQAQAQTQAQTQANFDRLFSRLHSIEIEQQVARATNANLIIGSTGVATGAQTANPVNVK